jgi:hypothetical protein
MKGYIITYDASSNKDILDINNSLFGRVVKIKRRNGIFLYYYSGLFHNTRYLKLSNGCYFIPYTDIDLDLLKAYNINIYNTEIIIAENALQTAEQYFRNKFEGETVINLDNR